MLVCSCSGDNLPYSTYTVIPLSILLAQRCHTPTCRWSLGQSIDKCVPTVLFLVPDYRSDRVSRQRFTLLPTNFVAGPIIVDSCLIDSL